MGLQSYLNFLLNSFSIFKLGQVRIIDDADKILEEKKKGSEH